jgi:hypothetical protein
MKYEISYSEEKKVVIGKVDGYFDLSAVSEIAGKLAKLNAETNCDKVLTDLRNAEITNSTMEICRMPKAISEAGLPRMCMIALLIREVKPDYRFLETVSMNHGQQVELFNDMGAAIAWLNSDSVQE